MLSRLRSRLDAADPILKILGLSTLIGTLGRGVFLTVTVLYFHFIVGLSDAEISIVVGRIERDRHRRPPSSAASWPTVSAPDACCSAPSPSRASAWSPTRS